MLHAFPREDWERSLLGMWELCGGTCDYPLDDVETLESTVDTMLQ